MDCKNVLPSDVLFVGGNVNFVKKLKKAYPSWVFIDPCERNCGKARGEFSLVVICANHTSHNIVERVMSRCKDVPVIYTNCTNVDRVTGEISERIMVA